MIDYSFKSLPSPVYIKNMVEVLRNLDFQKKSGCMKINIEIIEEFGQEKAKKILSQYSPEFELFREVFENQTKEAKSISKMLLNFLNGVSRDFDYSEFFRLLIRSYRLMEIFKPDYSVTKAFNKKIGKEYDTSKGFWITDDCERKRIFNKNLGVRGWEIEKNMRKLIEGLYPGASELPRGYKGIAADMLIQDQGKGALVEIRIDSINDSKRTEGKKAFFDVYMSLEMWQLYKSIYKV